MSRAFVIGLCLVACSKHEQAPPRTFAPNELVADASFGKTGQVDLAGMSVYQVLVLSDESLVLYGYRSDEKRRAEPAFARLDARGALVPDFGSGGYQSEVERRNLWLAADTRGHFYAYGATSRDGDADVLVTRYSLDGRLDPTFGDAGVATLDLGGAEEASALFVLDDGTLIVVGAQGVKPPEGDSRVWVPDSWDRQVFVSRMSPAGKVDRAKDTAFFDPVHGQMRVKGAARQRDGKLVVIGDSMQNLNHTAFVARIDDHGAPDSSFGPHGVVLLDNPAVYEVRAVILDASERPVIAGTQWSPLNAGPATLVRLTTEGKLDGSFGSGGLWLAPDLKAEDSTIDALWPCPDGGLIAIGIDAHGAGDEPRGYLRHFNAKGTPTKRIVSKSRLTDVTSTFDAHGNVILAGSEIPMENNEHLYPRGHVERFVASAPPTH